jgi:hypothetical protein
MAFWRISEEASVVRELKRGDKEKMYVRCILLYAVVGEVSGKVAYEETVPLDKPDILVQRLGSDDRGIGVRFTAGKRDLSLSPVSRLPLGPIHPLSSELLLP